MGSVRVRIAPSPTGSPHVGTGYMGLFNYAFAKSQGGQFILRIEDTDQTRSRPEYENGIIQSLQWLGLTWDEGPEIGGPYGPYRQSERTEIYREYAAILLEKGNAYRCFCSESELTEMRMRQKEDKVSTPIEDPCRSLSEEAIREKIQAGMTYTIRLKVPRDGECEIRDRLRGTIMYGYQMIDDTILLKSDSFPTYHLANVVDDHLMGITHVIRGEEWVPSTPKHLLLYSAFGWEPPEFIHLPLLLNPDGSKLSKRKNPTSMSYYREAGFLPESLLNYLGLMSYSRPNQEEKFLLSEFVSDFDIDRISLGGAIFDLKKLKWLNGRYIREDFKPDALYQRFKDWRLNDTFMIQMIPMMQNRLETLGDLIPACDFLFQTDVNLTADMMIPKNKVLEDIAPVIQVVLFKIDEMNDWTAISIEEGIREVADFFNWPIRDITSIMFPAVMGKKVGPPLFDSISILGVDLVRRRLSNALEIAGGLGKKKVVKLEKNWIRRNNQSN